MKTSIEIKTDKAIEYTKNAKFYLNKVTKSKEFACKSSK